LEKRDNRPFALHSQFQLPDRWQGLVTNWRGDLGRKMGARNLRTVSTICPGNWIPETTTLTAGICVAKPRPIDPGLQVVSEISYTMTRQNPDDVSVTFIHTVRHLRLLRRA
jgi:hypothetical protein